MARRYPILSFVLLAYAITAALAAPLALSNRGLVSFAVPPEWEALAAFGPFLAAWIVLRYSGDEAALARFWASLRQWHLGKAGWILVLGTPVFLFFIAIAGAALIHSAPPSFDIPGSSWTLLRAVADVVIVGSLLQSLGEEPGWRGFLLPRLRNRWGPISATFILFPIWLFWHSPMILARPEFDLAQFAGFAVGILSAAIWLTLIFETTQSILAAVIWHALINLTRNTALAISMLSFQIFGAAVLLGAIGILIWLAARQPNVTPSTNGALRRSE